MCWTENRCTQWSTVDLSGDRKCLKQSSTRWNLPIINITLQALFWHWYWAFSSCWSWQCIYCIGHFHPGHCSTCTLSSLPVACLTASTSRLNSKRKAIVSGFKRTKSRIRHMDQPRSSWWSHFRGTTKFHPVEWPCCKQLLKRALPLVPYNTLCCLRASDLPL